MTLTFVGVVIFWGAYNLQILASRYPFLKSDLAKALGSILVIMIAFGAQAGVLRGIVLVRMEQINFIRTELMAKNPADYKDIIVVLPGWHGCITEPCDIWLGQTVDGIQDMSRPGVYRYALTTLNMTPDEKNIIIVTQKPDIAPESSIIIDWNKYALARKQYLEYLQTVSVRSKLKLMVKQTQER